MKYGAHFQRKNKISYCVYISGEVKLTGFQRLGHYFLLTSVHTKHEIFPPEANAIVVRVYLVFQVMKGALHFIFNS